MEPRHSPSIVFSLFLLSVLTLILNIYGSYGLDSSIAAITDTYIPLELRTMSGFSAHDFESSVKNLPRTDHVSVYFADPNTRPAVLSFFADLTGNFDVAAAILEESTEHGVAPALAFALAFEESGFDPGAYNKNSSSVDRGIFQLNSISFPGLKVEQFYDIKTNVRFGLDHLAFCIKQGGNEVAALAVYNAGLGRVSTGGTPRKTLDYIYRIIGYRDRLEVLFEALVVAKHADSKPLVAMQLPAKMTN
jgi:hypothetical protein